MWRLSPVRDVVVPALRMSACSLQYGKTPLDGIRDFHRGASQRPPVKFHDKKI